MLKQRQLVGSVADAEAQRGCSEAGYLWQLTYELSAV